MAQYSQQAIDDLINTYQQATGTAKFSPQYTTKKITIPNPELAALDDIDRRLAIRAGKKAEVQVEVPVMRWENPSGYIEAYVDPITQQYEVQTQRVDSTPTLPRKETPEADAVKEAQAIAYRREAEWNRDHGPGTKTLDPESGQEVPGWGSGRYESHEERSIREAREATARNAPNIEARAVRDQQIQEEDRIRAQEERDANRRLQQATEARLAKESIESQNARIAAQRLAEAKFDAEKEKAAADAARLDRPQVLGTPSDTSANVAVWDPVSQTMRSVANPIYDEAKVQAARLKDQLSVAISLNQISAQQAAQQYKQWWDTNVELPFKQAQEQRARAAEQRAALEAEDRRKQFASDFSLRSSDLGFRAGNAAVENEISLLPYRAGPEAGEQFSAAFNSLARGGKVYGPDASAGINFTPAAFEFDRPDFEGIAKRATANALKGLTKYKPEGSFAQASYEGIATPSGAGAPSGAPMIDTSSLWQQFMQSATPAYTGPPPEE